MRNPVLIKYQLIYRCRKDGFESLIKINVEAANETEAKKIGLRTLEIWDIEVLDPEPIEIKER